MPIKLNTTLEEIAHFNRLNKYAKQVEKIYLEALKEFQKMAGTLKIDPAKPFSFKDFPGTNTKAKKLLQQLSTTAGVAIEDSIRKEWNAANVLNDKLVGDIFHKTKLSGERLLRFKNRNVEALNAFQTRKINGLGLSDRVWNNTQQFGKEVEMALDIGLGEGKSAAALGRDMRKYLNDPDMIWGKLRQKHGAAEALKIWDDYKPGQGRYKSSIKNAERLTRTETNMAYRASDHERWKQMDFIVGFEIRRSNNPFGCPVCESLKGKYPKGYVWTGNHPQCRCYKVPIMMTDEELDRMEDLILNDDPVNFKSVNEVKQIPVGAKLWWDENKHRAKNWKSVPLFIKDNQKFYTSKTAPKVSKPTKAAVAAQKAVQVSTPNKLSIPKIKSVKDIDNLMQDYQKMYPDDFTHQLKEISTFSERPSMLGGYTMMKANHVSGRISMNDRAFNHSKVGAINPYKDLKNALNNIRGGKSLSFGEEYATESFYHEILHMKAKGMVALKRHNMGDYKRTAMETLNQFVARHDYVTFIDRLGGKATMQNRVLTEGLGYSGWVDRFRELLAVTKIKEQTALTELRPVLLEKSYDKIDSNLFDWLKKKIGSKFTISQDDFYKALEKNTPEWGDLIKNIAK